MVVVLDFVHKQLLDGCKALHPGLQNHIILDTVSKRKIARSCKYFIPQLPELQYCKDGRNKHLAPK